VLLRGLEYGNNQYVWIFLDDGNSYNQMDECWWREKEVNYYMIDEWWIGRKLGEREIVKIGGFEMAPSDVCECRGQTLIGEK